MDVTFNGGRLTAGVPIGEVNTTFGAGVCGGRPATVDRVKSNSVGLSAIFNHFTLNVPCNCELQAGDWIEVETSTILFVNFGTVRYSLCGGACTGKAGSDLRGLGIGLDISKIRWVCH
jgi:hypothetical protein